MDIAVGNSLCTVWFLDDETSISFKYVYVVIDHIKLCLLANILLFLDGRIRNALSIDAYISTLCCCMWTNKKQKIVANMHM